MKKNKWWWPFNKKLNTYVMVADVTNCPPIRRADMLCICMLCPKRNVCGAELNCRHWGCERIFVTQCQVKSKLNGEKFDDKESKANSTRAFFGGDFFSGNFGKSTPEED